MDLITAREWTPNYLAYLWEETGDGSLRIVSNVNKRTWWIYTGTSSWCCTPDTRLYVGTPEEIADLGKELQRKLAERRNPTKEK